MPGEHPGLTDGEGRGVVQAQPRTHGESFHRTAGERDQQRDPADQVRRRAVQQQIALAAQGGDGGDTDPTEVDQATVHQGAGPAGSATAPVTGIDQSDPEATGDRVQGDPGADDAATDDEHVEVGGSQLGGGGRSAIGHVRSLSGVQERFRTTRTSVVWNATNERDRELVTAERAARPSSRPQPTTTSTRWNSLTSV